MKGNDPCFTPHTIYFNQKSSRNSWKNKELINLLDFVEKHGQDWKIISKEMISHSKTECQRKYSEMKSGWIESPWTPQEDICMFYIIINQREINWNRMSVTLKKRSPESCLRRWSVLKEQNTITGGWGNNEQLLLFELTRIHGSDWRQISDMLPMRTRNLIKGFAHASFRKIKIKKQLYWCLEKTVRWPTHINRSRAN